MGTLQFYVKYIVSEDAKASSLLKDSGSLEVGFANRPALIGTTSQPREP
jgi:hypothetical protein